VLRTHPGKEYGFLVDLTDNTSRFGTDLDRIKVTVPKAVEAMEAKERTMWKICPNCEIEVHIALRECSACGFEWPETECVVAAALPTMKSVEFQGGIITASEPEWYDVDDFETSVHESKKNGKHLGRLDFFYYSTEYKKECVSMFLCFPDFYSGYAVQASQKKWQQISDDPFPESVDSFQEKQIYVPVKVQVDINGKYPALKAVEVTTTEFLYVLPEFEDDEIPF